MKVAKSLLLGTAAVLATVAGAQAADLPTRKAAPVQYVKICDAYGAGFFYIPGTDTCLRVGGLVLADLSVSNTPNRLAGVGGAVTGRQLTANFRCGVLFDPANLSRTASLSRREFSGGALFHCGDVRCVISLPGVAATLA